MIRVQLSRLVMVDGHDQQIIQLEEAEPANGEARHLTIAIGPAEANEIGRCLNDAQSPRPLTHELLYNIIGEFAAGIVRAVVHDVKNGTFFAELVLERAGEELRIDCRPSDAIALSLRGDTPIFVTEEVMAEAGSS